MNCSFHAARRTQITYRRKKYRRHMKTSKEHKQEPEEKKKKKNKKKTFSWYEIYMLIQMKFKIHEKKKKKIKNTRDQRIL